MVDRRTLIAAGIAGILVIVAVLGVALRHADGASRPFQQSNGVPPLEPVVRVRHGHEVCESGIALAQRVHRVQFVGQAPSGVAPELGIRVVQEGTGRVLASTPAPGGPFSVWTYSVPVPAIDDARPIDVCMTNRGRQVVDLLGLVVNDENGPFERVTPPQLDLVLDGRKVTGDVTMDFPYEGGPRTVLSLMPHAVARAASYRLPGFGSWATWSLLVLALTVVPAVLLRAVAAAVRDAAAER
jgi:hypothetical protein